MNLLRNSVFFLAISLLFTPACAGDLTQERWISIMIRNLPKVFCAKDQFYRVCYDVSQEDCLDAVAQATADCIDENLSLLPEAFAYKDIRHWGPVIENCIDKDYIETYVDFYVDSEECKNMQ